MASPSSGRGWFTGLVVTTLVGREHQLAQLALAVERARDGRGSLTAILGEAGVGKSQLCAELVRGARTEGLRVGWVSCWESAGLGQLWPWHALLAQLGGESSRPVSGESDPGVARDRSVSRVVDDLGLAVGDEACVVVIDDLQWADPSSLRVLTHLMTVLPAIPVAVVVAVRTGGGTVPESVELVARRADVVHLGGLGASDLCQLASVVLGDAVDAAIGQRLFQLTGGNPLFAIELVRAAHGHGGVSDLFEADPHVPPTVRAVLGERLGELSAPCRDVVAAVAAVAQETSFAVLADVTGRGRDELLGAVDEAVDQGILDTPEVGWYRLAHPLLRNVVYDALSVAQRAELHGRIARALAEHHERGQLVDPAVLSHHYFCAALAGEVSNAVRVSIEAAEAAMQACAFDDAVDLYGRALAAAALDPAEVDVAPLLVGSGRARLAAGDRNGGRTDLLRAADLARSSGALGLLAEAALAMAGPGFEVPLFDEDQLGLLEEALRASEGLDDRTRALLSARLSVALSLGGQDERRELLATTAVELAESLADPTVQVHALAAHCDVLAGPAHLAQRSADAAQIVRLAGAGGGSSGELLGRRLRIVAALERGDLAAATDEIRRYERAAHGAGPARYGWYVPLWRATLAAAGVTGEDHGGLSTEAEQLGRRSGSPNAEILVATQRWFALLNQGAVDEAVATLESAMDLTSVGMLDPREVPYFARHRLETSRLAEARKLVDGAAAALRAMPQDSEWLPTLVQFAELAHRLGGHDLVPWLYDALVPFGDQWAVEGIGAYTHGPAHRHLGLLASLLGRRSDAEAHFDRALSTARQQGAAAIEALILTDRATALGTPDPTRPDRRLSATEAPSGQQPEFRIVGDVWHLVYDGDSCSIRDNKGMRDLAALLAAAGREIAVVDLAAEAGPPPPEGDLGPSIDARARDAYRLRLVDLDEALDEADQRGDVHRCGLLAAERDALLAELAHAYGLGGRDRPQGDRAERARTAVTSRIRYAIRRIGQHHPALARHLDASIRTGRFCAYRPDRPIDWRL